MDPKATMEPSISVIIPVYNEGAVIDGALRRVRESAGGPVEFVVVDGGPGGRTLEAMTDRDVLRVTSPAGRGTQMNAGAAVASGDILLFLHADTVLPHGWPGMVRSALKGGVVAGAFALGIDSPRFALKLVAVFANLRTRLERVPYGDQAPFIDAAYFRSLGGFADIPIMEDVELFRRIRRLGGRIRLLPARVLTSPRRWERDGVLRRTLSNWRLRLRYALGARAEDLVADYRPHHSQGRRPSKECLLFFVRYPEPGRVKTRLAEGASPELAAAFYRGLVEEKLRELEGGLEADLIVCFTPESEADRMADWLGPERRCLAQRGTGLGSRMELAFRDAFGMGYERAVLAGSDIPGLTAAIVEQALAGLTPSLAALGPASDGGYYLIGFHRDGFAPGVFAHEQWGDAAVCERAAGALSAAGLDHFETGRLDDLDTLADVEKLLALGEAGPLTAGIRRLARKLSGR